MAMKNRLILKLREKSVQKEKIFCAFLTFGYPSIKTTEKLMKELEAAGVDMIELGFPFSDPLADGPTIQYSSEQALKKGVTMQKALSSMLKLREEGLRIPVLFFSYLNPILSYGQKKFVKDAVNSGFDGAIVPDLPPEEEPEFSHECEIREFPLVYLVAPTTEAKRAGMISRRSKGFIYYVSLKGVTGARKALPSDVKLSVNRLRKATHKPVLIGFGVSNPDQSKRLSRLAEGVIVGSAIINQLRKSGGKTEPVIRFVKRMIRAAHSK